LFVAISDFQINSKVRSVLAKHWIDLQKITFGSFRGTVRFSGELCLLGGRTGGGSEMNQVESLESEVRSIRGVQRIYFDLSNWHRNNTGQWSSSYAAEEPAKTATEASASAILEMKVKGKSTEDKTNALKEKEQ